MSGNLFNDLRKTHIKTHSFIIRGGSVDVSTRHFLFALVCLLLCRKYALNFLPWKDTLSLM